MKKQLLFIVCIFMHLCISYSQGDQQWLIMNGLGKSGYSGSSNIFGNSFDPIVIPQQITLEGIKHPCRKCNYAARNDIFVIYSDGTYYNSRWDTQHPDFFFPRNADQSLNQVNHNFTVPSGKTISNLYLTNMYEEDDPTLGVRAKNGFSGQNNKTPYVLGTSHPDSLITANHNVVKDKDITLIIKGGTVANGDILKFKARLKNTNIGGTYGPYFTGADIGMIGGASNVKGITWLNDKTGIVFNNPPLDGDIYINLRPDVSSLINYFPTVPNSDPYDAVFELFSSGELHASLSERMRDSYDPNYMQIASLCENNSGEQFINYHLQFENTSFQPADNLEIEITLPEYVYQDSIGSIKWRAGTNNKPGLVKFDNSNKSIIFIFDPGASVRSCRQQNDPKSIGSVDFCVKVKKERHDKSKYIEDLPLIPMNGIVRFNKTEYPLKTFYDLPDKEGSAILKERKFIIKGGCTCELQKI